MSTLDDDGSARPLLGQSSGDGSNKTVDDGPTQALSASFFLLGLLNNVLYVIILSAALDLVPVDVPKGVILFANIFPSLIVKLGWPYFIPGRVRYGRRVFSCSLLSFFGIVLVAASTSLAPRLFGISLASFSSGLGEMTYLQRTTVYGDDILAKLAVGWFASGTGAAGLVGAGMWWILRGLGVKAGLGISSILPVCMGVVFFALLPKSDAFGTGGKTAYTAVPATDALDNVNEEEPTESDAAASTNRVSLTKPRLTTKQKIEIAKPLFLPFMIPLFVVYFAEYTVNTGVSPTLLYPVPDRRGHPLLASIIQKLSDYYPLWQLVYQTFVFFSRSSSVIFRVPALPPRLIPLPSVAQAFLLLIAITESTHSVFSSFFRTYAIVACFLLIAVEGLCGGLAYVNVFLRIGLLEDDVGENGEVLERKEILARREFRIACVGFADTLGILAASLVSSWLEPTLCRYQVAQGRNLCREVK